MKLETRLDTLSTTLCSALQALPAAAALCRFGSLAAGTGDQYSDIDLQIMTADLTLSMGVCYDILEHIGPIALVFPIMRTSTRWASTILFQNESYYHKVDLGFTVASSVTDAFDTLGTARNVLWEQSPPSLTKSTGAQASRHPYEPERGTLEHVVIDHLLGGVRYVKARKRGQALTCWRFASATANGLMKLLLQRTSPGQGLSSPLTTWEYVVLDRLSEPAEIEALLTVLDFSTPGRMDAAVSQLLTRLVAVAMTEPSSAGSAAACQAIRRLVAFIQRELGQT